MQHYINSSGLNTVCFHMTIIMILQCCGTQKSSNDLVVIWQKAIKRLTCNLWLWEKLRQHRLPDEVICEVISVKWYHTSQWSNINEHLLYYTFKYEIPLVSETMLPSIRWTFVLIQEKFLHMYNIVQGSGSHVHNSVWFYLENNSNQNNENGNPSEQFFYADV